MKKKSAHLRILRNFTVHFLMWSLTFALFLPINVGAVSEPDPVAEAFDGVYNALMAEGIVNNLNTVNMSNYTAFSNLYFEKRTDVSDPATALGRITFTSALDLSSTDTQTFLQNLGAKMEMSGSGAIGLDLSGATESVALKNVSADLKFYNLDELGFGSGATAAEIDAKLVAYDDEGNLLDKSTLISGTGTYVGACGVGETDCYYYLVGVNHFTQYEIDNTAPVISETTPVANPTTNTTPSYTFTTDEAGTITYGGDCSSTTTGAVVGANTITFNALSIGTHNNCTIKVTDPAGNSSNTLNMTAFEIKSAAPNFAYNYEIAVGSGIDSAVDATGNVYATYVRSGSIYVTKNRNAEMVIPNGGSDSVPTIAVGSGGTIHVAFVRGSNIMYAQKQGSNDWTVEVASAGSAPDIDVDNNGKVHIAGALDSDGGGYNDVIYVNNVSGSFSAPANIFNSDYRYYFYTPGIKVDQNGKYHITSYHHSIDCGWSCYHSYSINYATNAYGGYSSSVGNNGSITNKGIALNANNSAQIVYGFGGNAVFATPYSAWSEAALVAGSGPVIAIKDGVTGIAYLSSGLKYLENTGSGWSVIANLDASGTSPSVALNGEDRFVYYEKDGKVYLATNQELFVAPVISGVSEGGLYNTNRTITWDNGTGLLNGNAFTSGETVSLSGDYSLTVTNSASQSTTVNFQIDKIAPTITIGAYDTAWTNSGVVVTASTNEGTLNATSHTFTANGSFDFVATDSAGNQSTETVTISNIDKTNPTGAVASPSAGSLLKGTVTVTTAEVADTDSGIERIEFWHNSVGTKIGEDTTAPYSISWDTTEASDGTHTLSLRMYDNAGNYQSSAGVSVIIDNTKPTNQNTVFPTNKTVPKSSEVEVISAEETAGAIWFAPAGTTVFSTGATMTTASGTATSIYAPSTEGNYKLFVIDATGNVSDASTAILTTTENTPPQLLNAQTIAVNKIEVNFDEDLDGDALVVEDFEVKVGETEITIDSLSENNGKVTLTLASNLNTGDTPTVTINPEEPQSIKDLFGNEQTATVSVTASDKINPTVTKVGDDSADVTILANATGSLVFSEKLSSAGKTAVENALSTGADKVLTYAWNGNSDTLTITGNASATTTFANDVKANVTDFAGNSVSLLLIDSKLETTQVAPTGTGTAVATINNTTPQVVITDPVLPVEVTITSGTTNPSLDVSAFIDNNGTGVLPEITIDTPVADIEIPATTTITSADTSWNGVIAAPTVTTVDLPTESGQTKTLSSALEVGFTGAKLSFDKGVRLILPNQAGKRIGYTRTGTAFTEITAICSADTQAVGDALAADGDCKIDVGVDLVIWTKHFTKFASYTQTTDSSGSSSSSGGGGGGASVNTSPYQMSTTVSTTAVTISNRSLDLAKITETTTRPLVMKNTEYGITLEIPQGTKISTATGIYQGIISKPTRLGTASTPVLPNDYQKLFGAEIKTTEVISFDQAVKLTLPVEMSAENSAENVKVFAYNADLEQYEIVGSGGVLSKTQKSIVVEIQSLKKFVVVDTKGLEANTISAENVAQTEKEELHSSATKEEFTDIRGHWALGYIQRLQNAGVVQGKQAGVFEPDTTVTRAELTKMVLLAFEYEVAESVAESDFSDVQTNDWFAPYIAKAKELGLIEGYADGTFKPNQTINRAEALKILLMASQLQIEGGEMDFSDTTQGAWYEKYVAYAKKQAIVGGYSDGTFGPGKNITRAEVSKIIVKTMDLK